MDREEEYVRSEHKTLTERVERLERVVAIADIGSLSNVRRSMAVAGAWGSDFRQDPKGGGWTDVDEKRRPTAFEDVMQRIEGSTDRLYVQVKNLSDIGNRILGVLPEGAAASGNAADVVAPDGTLEHAFFALGSLDDALARLEFVAGRLERI